MPHFNCIMDLSIYYIPFNVNLYIQNIGSSVEIEISNWTKKNMEEIVAWVFVDICITLPQITESV